MMAGGFTDTGAVARAGVRALLAAPPVDALRLVPLLSQARSQTPIGDLPALLDLADLLLDLKQGFLAVQLLGTPARQATGRARAVLALRLARANQMIGQHGMAQRLYQSAAALAPDLAPLPTEAEAPTDGSCERLFDVYAEHFDNHLTNKLQYQGPALIEALLAESGMKKDLHILDAGCGTGLCQPVLAPYAERLDGCDLSLNMLDKSRQRGGYAHLWWSDLLSFLPREASRWDMIVATDVLLYIQDIEAVLRHVASALRSGGHFVFSLLSTQEADREQHDDGHYRHGDRYVRGLAAACGFSTLVWREIVLRYEQGKPVDGRLVMLQKP